MRLGTILLSMWLLLSPHAGKAEEPNVLFEMGKDALFYDINEVFVTVKDNVNGGCFTNLRAVKNVVELALRRNGISVVNDNKFLPEICINVMGFADKNKLGEKIGCIVSVEYSLKRWLLVNVPYSDGEQTFLPVEEPINSMLYSNGGVCNSQIKRGDVNQTEELLNHIYKVRSEIKKKWPRLVERMEEERAK